MSCKKILFSAVCAATVVSFASDAAELNARIVFLKNKDLYVSTNGEQPRKITSDGVEKYLPVWSKDGSDIAYLEVTDRSRALGKLVVIDLSGRIRQSILLRPTEKEPSEGMRFVETIEWLSKTRIAISGSINPSTAENVIVDLNRSSHPEINSYFDDGVRAVYSPDGLHIAYEDGSPHFSETHAKRPRLNIDGKPIFPPTGVTAHFLSAPVWAPDSKRVAVVVKRGGRINAELVIAEGSRPIVESLVGSIESEPKDMYWQGADLIVVGKSKAWRWRAGADVAQLPASEATSKKDQIKNVKRPLKEFVDAHSGTFANFWCQQPCALSSLPRRATLERD